VKPLKFDFERAMKKKTLCAPLSCLQTWSKTGFVAIPISGFGFIVVGRRVRRVSRRFMNEMRSVPPA
jgi:hypothetical protein